LLFVIVMALTAYKDWWLTGEEPNILFYLFVPPVSILGGALSVFGVARAIKQTLTFLETLAVIVSVNVIMQCSEIVLKIIYYRVWEYPGIMYVLIVIPMGAALYAYGLVRWGRVKWWIALALSVVEFVGEVAAAALLTGVPGLSTPGS
jgi:hypothetical protein